MKNKPIILPIDVAGGSRTATIKGLTVAQVTKLIGFKPNVEDDPDKVENSWGFTVDGESCGVWDYKGSHRFKQFSADGPIKALKKVFGKNVS
jgi:hypothetical protein